MEDGPSAAGVLGTGEHRSESDSNMYVLFIGVCTLIDHNPIHRHANSTRSPARTPGGGGGPVQAPYWSPARKE